MDTFKDVAAKSLTDALAKTDAGLALRVRGFAVVKRGTTLRDITYERVAGTTVETVVSYPPPCGLGDPFVLRTTTETRLTMRTWQSVNEFVAAEK
jgi:hypothetical protein